MTPGRSSLKDEEVVKAQIMRRIRLTMAILAIASSAGASLAGDVATVSRNCTWCHGTLGHGYTTAPRLAGQRHQYIENQLYDFRTHVRDNPFSQQYMWGATANLGLETARDLADYFSTRPSQTRQRRRQGARGDRTGHLSGGDSGIRHRLLRRLSWPQRRGHRTNSPFGRTVVFLLEEEARAVGRGIPCGRRTTDASHREPIGPERNRGARVIPQFRPVEAGIMKAHRLEIGAAHGDPDCFLRGGSRAGQGHRFATRASGQDRLLQNLPRLLRARLSRILSDAAARGTARRVHRKSAARLHRAQAAEPGHVQRGARSQPGDGEGSCRVFRESRSETSRGRPEGARGRRKKDL